MEFDIEEKVFDRNGQSQEGAVARYRAGLMKLFAESPEGQAILDEDGSLGDARLLLEYGIDHCGVMPTEFTLATIEEVTFAIIPRKVSMKPEGAGRLIREFRAFIRFLVRHFGLKRLEPCLEGLSDDAIPRLESKLDDPRNFGMAKSFFMEGVRRGFDLSTQEGLDRWIAVSNAEKALGARVREPSAPRLRAGDIELVDDPAWSVEPGGGVGSDLLDRAERERRKKKRKMEKASRKRNRRR